MLQRRPSNARQAFLAPRTERPTAKKALQVWRNATYGLALGERLISAASKDNADVVYAVRRGQNFVLIVHPSKVRKLMWQSEAFIRQILCLRQVLQKKPALCTFTGFNKYFTAIQLAAARGCLPVCEAVVRAVREKLAKVMLPAISSNP